MSIVFLSQTQDVIGHDRINPKTKEPHKPVGHYHRPSIWVDSVTGEPVQQEQDGIDPRDEHFSGTNGKTEDGYQTAWGFRYAGGTYSELSPPDCDTENVWYLRVDVEASTGKRHASLTVSPEIYLTHFDKESGGWQGSAGGTVTFSGVCFHQGILCISHSQEGDTWPETGYLDLTVQKAKISEESVKKYGAGFESNGASLTAESEHKYTTSYNQYKARGYRFILKLKVGIFNSISKYQDKSAEGDGQLMSERVQTDTAKAEYKYTDWLPCYCGDSKKPFDPYF